MSKGKYIIPVILGQRGRELFFVKGDIPRNRNLILVRKFGERGLTDKDIRHLDKLLEGQHSDIPRPNRVKELEHIGAQSIGLISEREATLVHGYVTNVLPGAFKAPELSNWYILERPSEITPLKLARFSINLLERTERSALVEALNIIKVPSTHVDFSDYW